MPDEGAVEQEVDASGVGTPGQRFGGGCRGRVGGTGETEQVDFVKELFDTVAPAFSDRSGGYTRIVKLGRRISDSSEMVLLEWVDSVVAPVAEIESE